MQIKLFLSFIFSFVLSFSFSVYGSSKVAKVIILKGKAFVIDTKLQKIPLKKGAWVTEGSKIKTSPKSFAKLLFNDKSQVIVGPKSEMQIASFKKGSAGVLNLLNGQIRAKVKKSYKSQDKNKMLIQTRTASMGVRGTEFLVTYNKINSVSNVLTYAGEVAMISLPKTSKPVFLPAHQLNNLIKTSKSVAFVKQGQFSSVNPKMGKTPTIPTKLSPAQFKALEKNTNLKEKTGRKTSKAKNKQVRNLAPPGLNIKKAITDNSEMNKVIGTQVIEVLAAEVEKTESPITTPPPEGFVNTETGAIAPPAGGFIDLTTGLYIPPPPGSTFDENTGVYVPPATLGSIDPDTGNYVNPVGFKLDDSGSFIAEEVPPSTGDSEVATAPLPPPPPSVIITENDVGTSTFEAAENTLSDEPPTEEPGDFTEDVMDDEQAEEIAESVTDEFENLPPENLPSTTNVQFEISVE